MRMVDALSDSYIWSISQNIFHAVRSADQYCFNRRCPRTIRVVSRRYSVEYGLSAEFTPQRIVERCLAIGQSQHALRLAKQTVISEESTPEAVAWAKAWMADSQPKIRRDRLKALRKHRVLLSCRVVTPTIH